MERETELKKEKALRLSTLNDTLFPALEQVALHFYSAVSPATHIAGPVGTLSAGDSVNRQTGMSTFTDQTFSWADGQEISEH